MSLAEESFGEVRGKGSGRGRGRSVGKVNAVPTHFDKQILAENDHLPAKDKCKTVYLIDTERDEL